MLSIGLVGTGNIAEEYVYAINRHKDTKLSGVYSTNKIRANNFGKKFNVRSFDSFSDFLDVVDVVIIANKNNEHADFAIKSIKKGKHVLLEKPVDTSLERSRKLIELGRQNSNLVLCVSSQHRFDDSVLRVKRMVVDGLMGKPLMASVSVKWHRGQSYYDENVGWRKDKDISGGGVLIQQAIHLIDILQWVFGRVQSVSGFLATLNHDMDVEDSAVAILKFKNGALGVIEATTGVLSPLKDRIELHGTKGSLVISGRKITVSNFSDDTFNSIISSKFVTLKRSSYGTIRKQFNNFIDKVKGYDSNILSGLDDGLHVLEIINAIYRSKGKEVWL